jgi:tetratricopeptide (TPR) repeat protein
MTRWTIIFLLGLALASVAAPAQKPAASGSPAQAAGPHLPQAKSKAEFNDYNAAYAISGGAAMEKAADDFAAKYPTSELRGFLYAKAMNDYQRENRADKILAMGEKVLTFNPNDPVALALTATVMSDSLTDTDKDREKKIQAIKKNAGLALQNVDTSLAPPANASPEQIAAYKNLLRSMAHSALGITALKMGDNPEAEKELKAAAEVSKAAPDGYVLYHLALAQDHQQKYAEALATIQEALRVIRPEEEIAKLAQGERERLLKLTSRMEPAK